MTKLVALALCCSSIYAQSTRTSELLQHVAATYSHITDYVIQIKLTKVVHTLSGAGAHNNSALPLGSLPPVNRIVLARSGKMFRYEVSNNLFQLIWTTDGLKTWQYRRDLKEYIEERAKPWPAQLGPGPGLPGIE